jgi:hypothetical protein
LVARGIIRLYYEYLQHLQSRKEFIAPLQLTGSLEDYFVREFIAFAFRASGGELLGMSNFGIKGEQKFDIAFTKGKSIQSRSIVGLIEAKYIGNAHRAETIDTARDEVSAKLKDLKRQLRQFSSDSHGELPVRLRSRNREVYGLVFVSGTKPLGEPSGKLGFHAYETPQLNSVYDDLPVTGLGIPFSVSLSAGLWRAGKS